VKLSFTVDIAPKTHGYAAVSGGIASKDQLLTDGKAQLFRKQTGGAREQISSA